MTTEKAFRDEYLGHYEERRLPESTSNETLSKWQYSRKSGSERLTQSAGALIGDKADNRLSLSVQFLSINDKSGPVIGSPGI